MKREEVAARVVWEWGVVGGKLGIGDSDRMVLEFLRICKVLGPESFRSRKLVDL